MIRKDRGSLCALALCCALLLAGGAAAQETEGSAIADLMALYGYSLPEEIISRMHAEFEPVTVDCGDVTVTLREILYDGRWLYTSATAVPKDPDDVLIFPSSAWLEDRVSGGYGEGEREDDRAFVDAATEDGKRLVCVSVYADVFDGLPEYFIDHFQRADDVSVLMSGGVPDPGAEALEINWKIRVYDIDLETGAPVRGTEVEALHRTDVRALEPATTRRYRAEEAFVFETLSLTRTGLTTYVTPDWLSEEDYYSSDFRLLDASGAEYPDGAPPEAYTIDMEALADTLYVELYDPEAEAWREPVLFVLDAE